MRVQVKRPRANEMGGRGSVMFEYVDTELFVSCLPVYLIKQTSLEESSWMSLYLESIGVVRGDPCEIRESFFRHC